jgi:hypothetical protein
MKSKIFTMAALAAAMLTTTSCSKDNDGINEDSQTQLRLASGVEVQTRAAFTSSNTQIPNGQTIAVYVDEVGASQLYGNNVLTANGGGGLSGDTPMFFPQSGANVDIYALHTNATLSDTYPATALTHTVANNQTTLAGYAPSDLLYARATDVAKQSAAVQLTFYHLLSKIEVAVVPGSGLQPSNIKGITIGGTRPSASFTPDKATSPNAVAITATGSPTNIAISSDVSTGFTTTGAQYNAAVLVPQTVAASTAFITVHLQAGSDLVYNLPSATSFESGKKYTYHITANLTGLTLTGTITNWSPVNPVTGTAQ